MNLWRKGNFWNIPFFVFENVLSSRPVFEFQESNFTFTFIEEQIVSLPFFHLVSSFTSNKILTEAAQSIFCAYTDLHSKLFFGLGICLKHHIAIFQQFSVREISKSVTELLETHFTFYPSDSR